MPKIAHLLTLICLVLAACAPTAASPAAPGSSPPPTSPANALPLPISTASPLPLPSAAASATQSPTASTTPTLTPTRAVPPTSSPTSSPTPSLAHTPTLTPPAGTDFNALGSGKIIFSSTHRNPAAELSLLDLQSGRVLRLIGNLFANNLSPSLSPDGRQVVFSSNPEGNYDLFLLDVDAASLADFPEDLEQTLEPFDWLERLNIRQLTHTPMNELDPDWSPDGSSITYIGAENLSQDLYILANGKEEPTRLTENLWLRNPDWSPDGTKIIFEDGSAGGGADLAWISASGGERIKLSEAPWISDRSPAWSPDSSQIAFCRMTETRYAITVMNADGSQVRQLGNSPYNDCMPAWSPHGMQILYVSERGGANNLFVMSVEGQAQHQLTFFDLPNAELQAAWGQ